MIEELKQLKELRKEIVEKTQLQEELEYEVHMTSEYEAYQDNHVKLDLARKAAIALEEAIKVEAVELSRQTGFEERKFGLVTIKEFTNVIINDMKQAVVWAAQNAPSCLTLTKDFNKAAKNLELSFVTVEKEYKAQIATDLSQIE